MQISKQRLLEDINAIKAGIGDNTVLFLEDRLVTYNGNVLLALQTEENIVRGTLSAEELISLLHNFSASEISVSSDEGHVVFTSGRSKAGIRFDKEIPKQITDILATVDDRDEKILPPSLLTALKQAKACASRSLSNPLLRGIHYADNIVTATNNYQAMSISIQGKHTLPEFLLPADCIEDLIQCNPDRVSILPSWIVFKNSTKDLLFCVRLLDCSTSYPDISQILTGIEGTEVLLPQKILKGIDKANIFTKSNKDDAIVLITIKKGRVVLRGEGAFGWYEENIPTKKDVEEEIKFAIKPDFLLNILQQTEHAIYDKKRRLLLFKGENFDYVSAVSLKEEKDI